MSDLTYHGMDVSVLTADFTDGRHYFEEAGAGRFVLPLCTDCSKLRFPPVGMCPFCNSTELEWREVEGKGTIYSYSVMRHAIHPGYRNMVPLVNVVVELDPPESIPTAKTQSIRIPGQLFRDDLTPEAPEGVGIGSRVEVVFDPIGDGLAYPQWKLTGDSPTDPWRLPL